MNIIKKRGGNKKMNIDKILNKLIQIVLIIWLFGVTLDFIPFELVVESALFLILAKLFIMKKEK